jgi:transposase
MAYLSAYAKGNQMYIYSVHSFRNEKKLPDNKKECVGKISKDSCKPLFKPDFINEVISGKSIISVEQFNEFKKRDFRSLMLQKNIIDNGENKTNTDIINRKGSTYHDNYDIEEIFGSIKDWGIPYFFNSISKDIGLTDILISIFGETIAEYILLIAIYLIVSNKSLMYCYDWINEIDVDITNSLTSQRISDLLLNINFNQRIEFYKKWYNKIKSNENIALDITSISTYSNNIVEAERGHNRDGEDLSQINLCVLFGEQTELPIYQSIYHGSLNDVSTLSCTVKEFESITNGHQFVIIMDKGFFSESNLNILIKNKIGNGFLISVPFTNNFLLKLIDNNRDIDSDPNKIIKSAKETTYGVTKEIEYGKNKHKLFAHLYFNPTNFLNTKQKFLKDLVSLQKRLLDGNILTKSQKEEVKKYLIISTEDDKINSLINPIIFEEKLKTSGWYILFSNIIDNAELANQLYRRKDVVEKSFDKLKNKLSLNRIRVHSSDRMEGKLFISFISIILISYINKQFKDKNGNKNYTLTQIFNKVHSLKQLVINSKKINRPITKEIKEIFSTCNIKIPSN